MIKLSSFTLITLTALSLLFFCPILAPAQSQTTGALSGHVRDKISKSPIAGVRVEIENIDTEIPASKVTDDYGYFYIPALPPGPYKIGISYAGFEPYTFSQTFQVDVRTDNLVKPPEISLSKKRVGTPATKPSETWEATYGSLEITLQFAIQPVGWAQTPTPQAPQTANPPATSQILSTTSAGAKQLVNTSNGLRGGVIDEHSLLSLPLPGIRTIETLAFLLPGVAPPPVALGRTVGPGIGAGIGTAGQFSVNGQRARSNNFTIDGSDNNDEDVGVRRQGFVALVPQSIESIQEFYLATHLWEAWEGRNVGSQADIVSRTGTNKVHGTFYDFFNHDAFNARNFFDYTVGESQSARLEAVKVDRFENGVPIDKSVVPVRINNQVVMQPNPSQGEDRQRRNQGGVSLGFPLYRNRSFFFGSFERQDIQARQETHFAVPTVAQRGFLNFGASRFRFTDGTDDQRDIIPTKFAGDDVFSVFPFANNPAGPYGENTFTQVLPADGASTIFSLKLDHRFKLFRQIAHTLAGRYNFTNDRRQIPAVGGAIFSGLEPRVRTQNLSLLLDSQLTEHLTSQLRTSFGRTSLHFVELRDQSLLPSRFIMNEPFLLNTLTLQNFTSTEASYVDYKRLPDHQADGTLGPVGQVVVTPFSPVGLDAYLFPQERVSNTYQLAEMLTALRGKRTYKYGFDLRRTQLNSFLNRNYRPQVVFGGTLDLAGLSTFDNFFTPNTRAVRNLSRLGPTPGFFSGSDLAALGLPTGVFQTLATDVPDSTIGLRFWQQNFFINDNWRLRPGLTLDYGLRYEYNSVPGEVNQRIERAFNLDNLPPVDPALRGLTVLTSPNDFFTTPRLLAAFAPTRAALQGFLAGRERIYEADRNNFGPHFSFAWDPFAASSTQGGNTAVRGGFGLYYDVTLGSVVSQSRNVFPTFVPINIDARTFPGRLGASEIFNPRFVELQVSGNPTRILDLLVSDKLNLIGIPAGALQPLLGLLFNPTALGLPPSGGGLAFTLPDQKLRSPYAYHFNLQVERELFRDYLFNVAYVGSRGLKLTRFRTPNGGPNSPTVLIDPLLLTLGQNPRPPAAVVVPPLAQPGQPNATRPNPGLGAFTTFDSSAASSYHSFQTRLTGRPSSRRQFSLAYTWSHAIDDVSERL